MKYKYLSTIITIFILTAGVAVYTYNITRKMTDVLYGTTIVFIALVVAAVLIAVIEEKKKQFVAKRKCPLIILSDTAVLLAGLMIIAAYWYVGEIVLECSVSMLFMITVLLAIGAFYLLFLLLDIRKATGKKKQDK